jgi:hypothetical protein
MSRGFAIIRKDGTRVSPQEGGQRQPTNVDSASGAESTAKGAMSNRSFWVVSPNVKYREKSVPEWKKASIDFGAAFMGWGPDDQEHKIGPKFAHGISEGDVILIARKFQRRPDVVGFGVVTGKFKKHLSGFKVPENEEWNGSLRTLSPFIPQTDWPPRISVMSLLNHSAALCQLHPDRNEEHRKVCEWMAARLSEGVDEAGRGKPRPKPPSAKAVLKSLADPNQLDFKMRTREMVRRARRKENVLVSEYKHWLENQGRELAVANYLGLRCDAYEEKRNNLIEAKSSTNREYIRMAVGQLLDYAYLGRADLGKPNMAILLPGKPDSKLLEWLDDLKIWVIWKHRREFLDNAEGTFV